MVLAPVVGVAAAAGSAPELLLHGGHDERLRAVDDCRPSRGDRPEGGGKGDQTRSSARYGCRRSDAYGCTVGRARVLATGKRCGETL